VSGSFRALNNHNYRLWAGGSLLSNVGTWIQRIAQDWLVLTQLTDKSATAMGIVVALQFAPMLVFLPLSGFAADHMDRRKLLIATQIALGVLALLLGMLTLSGMVALWHVYIFAALLGCVSAFDAPARQTFVNELVGDADLASAVALNSTSFNAARMIGPAVAGVLISSIGSGGAFLINAASFAIAIISLLALRVHELGGVERKPLKVRGGLADGIRYVLQRPDLTAVLVMLFLIGSFGLNFPVFISAMSVSVFGQGAGRYGLLMSMMAIGSIGGAVLTARGSRPSMVFLAVTAALFGIGLALAACAPDYWSFGVTLVIVGASSVAFSTATSSFMQLVTEPGMRGRIVALRLAVAMGGTPVGAPLVGWVADRFGPRWALGVGAASGILAGLVALRYMAKHRQFRMYLDRGRPRFRIEDEV
jgi:MFS family permease